MGKERDGRGEVEDTNLQLQLVACPPWLLQGDPHLWPVPAGPGPGVAVREEETQRRTQKSHLWPQQAARKIRR